MSKESSQESNLPEGGSPEQDPHAQPKRGLSRRGLFGALGAGAALVGAGAVAGRVTAPSADSGMGEVVAFRGAHQAGIATPAQDRMHFVSFDVLTDSRDELIELLRKWTEVAERLTAGEETVPDGATGTGEYSPPADTGEALGLAPSQLTLTIGFGSSLFGTPDKDRFGIYAKKPKALADLPHFPRANLDPARSGGDIAIQACANDPQVAVHAIRNLARIGTGTVAVRWSQLGFGRTSSTSTSQATPRNLFGFKDGTNNLKAEDSDLAQYVWADGSDDQGWMAGGTYLVARRIRMLIEAWDRTALNEQERVFGRMKRSGAPIGEHNEFDAVNLQAKGPHGLAIDRDAHIRLASHDTLGGIKLMRRGYNFTDGSDGFGHLDAGLFFIAFCRDPFKQFVPMQMKLAQSDALNEYIEHVASAVFAVPPGVGAGEFWGSTLFGTDQTTKN